jgi:hypothetical protein
MKQLRTYIVLVGLFLFLMPDTFIPQILSISITTTGTWSLTIDETDLQAGPGSDLNSTYTSDSDATLLDVQGSSSPWHIDVRKSDINWHSSLHIYIKRTGLGVPTGDEPTGGDTFQEITDTDQYFWQASNTITEVPHQYQLTGVTITIPPDNYQTDVVFTVTEDI